MCLPPYGGGLHNELMAIVCPFLCPLSDPKSRIEELRKMKIGRKEAHDMSDP